VEEVEVKVTNTEVLERVGNSEGDVLGAVVELEELGGDPELLTGDTGLGNTLSDFGLVACLLALVVHDFPDAEKQSRRRRRRSRRAARDYVTGITHRMPRRSPHGVLRT
jgi:hypothetical protein